jgi:cyclopropane fatty-acyl-phospholipid synthase-like methyltransferase
MASLQTAHGGTDMGTNRRGAVSALIAITLAGGWAFAAEQHQHGAHRAFDDPAAYTRSWDDPARDAWQRPKDLVAALGLAPGMAVADIGTGTGYLLPHLSRAAGAQGRVFAVDVSPQMLDWVRARAQREGLENIATVTASGGATGLAAGSLDRAIMINVWHHVQDQAAYARDLHAALRPDGIVLIVEARPDMEEEGGPPRHFRMQPATIVEQLRKAGFEASVDKLNLDRQFVVRGERR